MKEIKIGNENETVATVDKYGYVKIGKVEISADEMTILATISANERATFMLYKD